MTPAEVNRMLPIITAFAEGKSVEYKDPTREWEIATSLSFDQSPDRYRIKKEPTYRPFKDGDEFEPYHQKLIVHKHDVHLKRRVGWFDDSNIGLLASRATTYNDLFNCYQFSDGSPCGVLND